MFRCVVSVFFLLCLFSFPSFCTSESDPAPLISTVPVTDLLNRDSSDPNFHLRSHIPHRHFKTPGQRTQNKIDVRIEEMNRDSTSPSPSPSVSSSSSVRLTGFVDSAADTELAATSTPGFVSISGVRIPLATASTASTSLLNYSKQNHVAVSVRLNSDQTQILDVSIPIRAKVSQIQDTNGNGNGNEGDDDKIPIRLMPSAAFHFVKKSSPDADRILSKLAEAKASQSSVWVTEDDSHCILDVVPYAP